MSELIIKGQNAKNASYDLGIASTKQKDDALMIMAEELIKAKVDIISANKIDLDAAVLKGTSKAMLDRLVLTDERIESMAAGLKRCYKTSRSNR